MLTWAHPRLRGADSLRALNESFTEGSSPLTRGGLRASALASTLCGLIPAYAGRTYLDPPYLPRTRAHPRLRGADLARWLMSCAAWGSSPLTRGGRIVGDWVSLRPGLIPAYAGRTVKWWQIVATCGAHPRLRGADILLMWRFGAVWGSSPLTRGGLRTRSQRRQRRGLIPAYAGRTRSAWCGGRHSWAHPRLRGADQKRTSTYCTPKGSSPLTRGGRG